LEKTDNASISVSITNTDAEPLQYRFRSLDSNSLPLSAAQGGSFTPEKGTHSVDNTSAYPDIVSTYTAPDLISVQTLQVRVSNDLEIGVSASFKTYVTGPIDSQTTVDTNPVIESISGERVDNSTLRWTLLVSDDEPFSEMVSKWEYLAGATRTFDNITYTDLGATSNRSDVGVGQITALMHGYQDSDDGILQVTICEGGVNNAGTCADGQAGSTTVTMELVENAYLQPIICEGDCSSSDNTSTTSSSGSVGRWDQSTWDNAVFGE